MKLARIKKRQGPATENKKAGRKVRMPHANIEFVAPISKKNIKYTEDLDLSQLGKPELRRYQQAMYQRKRQQMKIDAAAKKKGRTKEDSKLQGLQG